LAERWPEEKELFTESSLVQVTVWCRGVLENKEARDTAYALASAAAKEGKYVQAWENYVDLPDRVNVPLRTYARISEAPIESKYIYENEAPEIVVLTDESLIKGAGDPRPNFPGNPHNPLEGLKEGGVLVVNTRRSPEYLLKLVGRNPNLRQLVCVDASGMGAAAATLSGQEGATDATGVGGGWAACLAGAVAKATGLVSPDSLKASVQNPGAAQRGYDTAIIHDVE
jgi:oxalate oxidoreductase subunit delta